MEPPILDKPKVKITPKITKISSLAQSAEEIKKTSTKLRKTFENGTYQKKTQLTVLNRYKKRLDSIQKQNDKRFLKKQRVKIKLPEIKKFAGSFFSAGSDPLKSIGALAAFNALSKGSKGDLKGAIGPALVAAGIFFGPGLVKGGLNLARGGISKATKPGAGIAAKPLSSGSISRVNASQARFIQGQANIGDRARLVRRGFISPMGMFSRGGVEETAKYGANSARVGKAFGRFGKAIVPVAGAALGAIDATMRAQEGDRTGAAIAGTSAALDAYAAASAATIAGLPAAGLLSIASFALDVVNLVRDLSGSSEKEAAKNKPEQDKLKKQTEEQKKLVEKKQDKPLTFGKSLDRYERSVNKFVEFSRTFTFGTRAKSTYIEGREPAPPPPPPGQNVVANTQVVQDAVDFRNQFPLGRGTPNVSMTPYELHLRENTMLHAAGIGNDPTVERVHAQGSAHYSNNAIDIPVNSKPLGDRVAQFWRSRGYYVIWQAPGHYDHVHVQWNAGSSQAGPPSNAPSGASAGKGYIIVPGHATGGGAPGEKTLVKRLAIDAYNKIKKQNPNAPVQYMDLDSTFSDDDDGWNKQKKWYESMERQGYQVLEIHMDQKGGIGKGVIRSHGQQSAVSNAWINQGNYAYPMNWRSPTNNPNHPDPNKRPLAGPNRGVDLFELGTMKSGSYSQSEINALNAPFVSSVLSSIRGVVRQTSVPIASNLPYQQGYRAAQPMVIPYPVVRQPQQQIMQGGESESMMLPGPSEQDLLNSFYKRVLLNTVA